MSETVHVLGVHPVEEDTSVHLVEILIKDSRGVFDVGQFTQELIDHPRSNWQVAYDEKILDSSGERIVADGFFERERRDLWIGDVRMAFFFHHLDTAKPLKTPLGDVALPNVTVRPSRLSFMVYLAPD